MYVNIRNCNTCLYTYNVHVHCSYCCIVISRAYLDTRADFRVQKPLMDMYIYIVDMEACGKGTQ